MLKRIEEYKKCIEEQRYFDAHEALEALWFPRRFEKEDDVKLLKGFINAAVSFELHKRGRAIESEKVWQNYLKYRPLLYKIEENKEALLGLSKYVEAIYQRRV
jgi:hypothetical protein